MSVIIRQLKEIGGLLPFQAIGSDHDELLVLDFLVSDCGSALIRIYSGLIFTTFSVRLPFTTLLKWTYLIESVLPVQVGSDVIAIPDFFTLTNLIVSDHNEACRPV